MARQYWVLISIWSICIAIVVLGIAAPSTNHALLGMPFLFTPVLSIVTLARVWRRDGEEVIGPKAKILHRVVIGACVLFAIGGIVGSAAQLATVDGETRVENGPLALLFLLSLVASWRALVRVSPRRTVVPALVVHVAWLPLFIANIRYQAVEIEGWQKGITALGLLGLLGGSAVAVLVALTAFRGESHVPEARQL